MDHKIRAKRERLLQGGRRESVFDNGKGAMALCHRSNSADIDQRERRVARGFEKDELGVMQGKRLGKLFEIREVNDDGLNAEARQTAREKFETGAI